MSDQGDATPLPWQWLPDSSSLDPKEQWRRAQENFDTLRLQVGSISSSSPATALTALYLGTWTNYTATAGFTPYYMKRAGIVTMGGAVTNLGAFIAGNMFTMPAGFRPASTEQFLQMAVGGAGGVATTGAVIIQIVPSGIVSFVSGITGGGLTNNMERISLSGITYGAAA